MPIKIAPNPTLFLKKMNQDEVEPTFNIGNRTAFNMIFEGNKVQCPGILKFALQSCAVNSHT